MARPCAAEQAKRGRTRQPSAQARKRLAFLCELLQLDEGDILDLRYQLLHRTAAAILEAQRFAAHHALMLVHSFSAEDAWLDEYQAFAQRMGARDADADAIVVVGERGGIPLYLSWIRGEERYARARSDSGRLPVRLPGSRGEAAAVFGVQSD
jgi:hypothetical protein